jgi:hypothetical protein
MTVPLVFDGKPIGKLALVGGLGSPNPVIDMQQLLEYLESLDAEVAQIVAGEEKRAPELLAVEAMPVVG